MRTLVAFLVVLIAGGSVSAQTTQPSAEDRLNQMLQPPAGGSARPLAPTTAPTVGQHTDEILAALGCDAAKIAELRERGAVG